MTSKPTTLNYVCSVQNRYGYKCMTRIRCRAPLMGILSNKESQRRDVSYVLLVGPTYQPHVNIALKKISTMKRYFDIADVIFGTNSAKNNIGFMFERRDKDTVINIAPIELCGDIDEIKIGNAICRRETECGQRWLNIEYTDVTDMVQVFKKLPIDFVDMIVIHVKKSNKDKFMNVLNVLLYRYNLISYMRYKRFHEDCYMEFCSTGK